MKEIVPLGNSLFHVISEPGDATRYDYFSFYDHYRVCFMPCLSTFRFPQTLTYDMIIGIDERGVEELSDLVNCNPFTLRECINTMVELDRCDII